MQPAVSAAVERRGMTSERGAQGWCYHFTLPTSMVRDATGGHTIATFARSGAPSPGGSAVMDERTRDAMRPSRKHNGSYATQVASSVTPSLS
jgi:hypothetical protein